jgi:hypothetical protein
MADLRELLGDLVVSLGVRYAPRIGGVREGAIEE